jgi:O-antigen/teichoic acid export membrane protein
MWKYSSIYLNARSQLGKYLQQATQVRHQIRDPLYRNSLFLIANTILTSSLGFFFWVVVARFYTEEEVGLGAAIISAMTLLALLSRLGLDIALIRFLPKAEKPVDMINSCFTLSGIVALAVAASFIKHSAVFSLAFVLFAFLWTLSLMMDFIFIARRRADFVLSKNTILQLLKIPLPILLVLFFRAFGIVSSWGLAIGVALVISLFFFIPRVQKRYKPMPKLNLGIIKDMWRYSAGNYFASLFMAAPALVLPIMIVNLLGGEENAYFYVAWAIATLLFVIPGAVSQSLFAEGSHFEDKLGVNVRRSYIFIFLLLIPAIILLLLLGKWLLLLYGESYSANALMLLWILGVSSLLVGVNSVYYSILRVRGRIRELVIIAGFITLAVLVGSYLITPTTGIIGIGYVWIAAQVVVSVYVLLAMRASYIARRV